MIKEILEYGDGPAPMPRLPMSAYPMGMVPSIHDQVSDHLKRNWLLYLLGGGALFGPGFKKLSAANKAYSALQRHTADNNRLHQLYDNGKHDDVLRAHGYDPDNFGDDKEKEKLSTKLMAANDMELQNKFGKAQETHDAAANSVLGGIFSPKDPNGLNSGLNFNGLGSPGVNFDAVEDEQRKQFDKQYKKVQNLMDDEVADYKKQHLNFDITNPDHLNNLKTHLKNKFRDHADVNHDVFNGMTINGQNVDINHFIKNKLDRDDDEQSDTLQRAQDAKDQQEIQKQQPDQTGLNAIKNAKTEEDRYNALKKFMHEGDANSDQDHIANAHQHLKILDDWENNFNKANTTQSVIDQIKNLAPGFAKDWLNLKQSDPIDIAQQTKVAGEGALGYLNSITNRGNSFGGKSNVTALNSSFLQHQGDDGKYRLLDLNDDNDRQIYTQKVRDHIATELANTYGVNVDHFKHIYNGGKSFADFQSSQQSNPNANPTSNPNANPNANPTSNPNANPISNPNANPNANPNTTTGKTESIYNINNLVGLYLTNEDSDEFGHDSDRDLNFDTNDNKKPGFLKKHYGKILAGLGAAALGITRNHLKANAHDENAQYFKSIGNHDLADSELAKAHVRRSIDPIHRGKNMYNSLKDRFSNSD